MLKKKVWLQCALLQPLFQLALAVLKTCERDLMGKTSTEMAAFIEVCESQATEAPA
jgi:hypothetical protein